MFLAWRHHWWQPSMQNLIQGKKWHRQEQNKRLCSRWTAGKCPRIHTSLDLQMPVSFWLLRLLRTFVRSRPQKVVVYQNPWFDCSWKNYEELYINDHQCVNFLICGPECLNPAKIALEPSINSCIDCSIGFGFHKFVSQRGDDRKHAKIRD